MSNEKIDDTPTTFPDKKNYIILPNGKKKYTDATGFDYILCLLLPGIGFVIGIYALIFKKETKRGGLMILISIIAAILIGVLKNVAR